MNSKNLLGEGINKQNILASQVFSIQVFPGHIFRYLNSVGSRTLADIV